MFTSISNYFRLKRCSSSDVFFSLFFFHLLELRLSQYFRGSPVKTLKDLKSLKRFDKPHISICFRNIGMGF